MDEKEEEFNVVINPEGQYSIWFADREPPAGWSLEGKKGTKQACLEHISAVWTDMRPLSIRQSSAQTGHVA